MEKLDPSSSVPLYKQLEQQLIGEICRGVYKIGEALPSISALDSTMSVGRVTIVKAMKELVRDGFAAAKHGKGYFVTELGEKALVGLVAPLSAGDMEIYVNLLTGLRLAVEMDGHRLVEMSSDEDELVFRKRVEELVHFRGSRWLVLVPPVSSAGGVSDEIIDFLRRLREERDVRMVIVDRELPDDFCQLHQDRAEGFELLLDAAFERGVRKLAFLGHRVSGDGRDELKRKALLDGVTVDFLPSAGLQDDIREMLGGQYDVACCRDDLLARKLVEWFGGMAPLSIAGYNGTASALGRRPQITTVNANLSEAGTLAFEMLSNDTADPGITLVEPFLMKGDTL